MNKDMDEDMALPASRQVRSVCLWYKGKYATKKNPLALALKIASFNFAKVLSVLVNGAGINPNEPYVIDDFRKGLHIRTNVLTHLIALWRVSETELCSAEVLHALLKYMQMQGSLHCTK